MTPENIYRWRIEHSEGHVDQARPVVEQRYTSRWRSPRWVVVHRGLPASAFNARRQAEEHARMLKSPEPQPDWTTV